MNCGQERAKVKAANEERCLEISQEIHELLVNAGCAQNCCVHQASFDTS